jgi:hypothetical protein
MKKSSWKVLRKRPTDDRGWPRSQSASGLPIPSKLLQKERLNRRSQNFIRRAERGPGSLISMKMLKAASLEIN